MKFLIVGLGSIGQRHYRNLRFLGFSDIAVYRTGKGAPDFIQKFEEEYRPAVFHDLTEAFRTGPDAVLIANPTALHTEFISAALRHGARGVFVEKPIGHKVSAAEIVVAEAEKKNIVGYVGYNFRFHPLLQKMKASVDEGLVGKVISASVDSGEYLPDWHTWEDYRRTYPARREMGGGVVLTQSHDIDYLYWFFGAPKRVAAFGGTRTGLEVDTDDLIDGILDYGNGGPVVSLHMDFYQRPARRVFEIMGSEGMLRWSYYEKKLELIPHATGREAMLWSVPNGFERNDMFVNELKHFIACLDGSEKPAVTFRDGLNILKIAEAILISSNSGEVINP